MRCSGEEIGMVAALLQVHHDIEEGDRLCATSVQLLKVAGQNPTIVLPEENKIILYLIFLFEVLYK